MRVDHPAPRARSRARRPRATDLGPGARAPAFRLAGSFPPGTSPRGGTATEASLSDWAGKPVVLYFYPKDFTSGCTREACDFRDRHAAFARRGAVVVGVSRDGVDVHARFREEHGLPFPLLSDPDGAVHRAYGAWGKKTLYGRTTEGALRTTVVIGPDGRVTRVFRGVRVDGHVEGVLDALAE